MQASSLSGNIYLTFQSTQLEPFRPVRSPKLQVNSRATSYTHSIPPPLHKLTHAQNGRHQIHRFPHRRRRHDGQLGPRRAFQQDRSCRGRGTSVLVFLGQRCYQRLWRCYRESRIEWHEFSFESMIDYRSPWSSSLPSSRLLLESPRLSLAELEVSSTPSLLEPVASLALVL